ncbi:hypothetical protein EVAR_17438_1 [Eumeta japonica]|uniref:1-acylglycerol-3-phosphate O-acyltransferase ABHD5 n=1 Tax=Eumeta variegata TaxID=151549 RepID=A0A4C1VA82_EUMVA|nr:hypothetical protein EVAR_17438_1 [Eumeta japonica]
MGSSEINLAASQPSLSAGWFSWTRQSDVMLRTIEQRILSCVKTVYRRFYVDIGPVVGECDKIWTIALNEECPETPLVLVHGMAAGVAFWCPNLDAFAASRPVYAFDLLGFGRSSRPKFGCSPERVEEQWVESVEQWRREMRIPQMLLLGHSLGGYISAAYAIKYPDRVKHLILADPWGFPERPSDALQKYQLPLWARAVFTLVQPLNPLWPMRAAGPAGRWLVARMRPDIVRKYKPYVDDAENVIPEYIHQCNTRTPSGESAFHTLMEKFGWARNPMERRVGSLDPKLPVTVLYGSRSWVDCSTADMLRAQRPPGAPTFVQVINGAGHHIYVDKPELFNKYVMEACARVDNVAEQQSNKENNET